MKLLYFILATYIFSLTISSSVTDVYNSLTSNTTEVHCGTNCCSNIPAEEKQNPSEEDSNGCCPNGFCNPFESCHCCTGVAVYMPSDSYISIDLNNRRSVPVSTGIISEYIDDCFHPPQFV